MSYIELC